VTSQLPAAGAETEVSDAEVFESESGSDDGSSDESEEDDEVDFDEEGDDSVTPPLVSLDGPDTSSGERTDATNEPQTNDDIVNLCPTANKPDMSFAALPSTSVATQLPSFLAEMAAANEQLPAHDSKGGFELDSDADAEQYIEMDLGLGVLEDTAGAEESDDEGASRVLGTLLDVKGKHRGRKCGIEEV
jgi:hypothetical protein